MSRILFLSQLVPYPVDAGPKIRSYFVLRHLIQKHSVTLLAFSRQGDTFEAIQHLEEFCAKVYLIPMRRSHWQDGISFLHSFISDSPFLIQRDERPEMVAAIRQQVQREQFDFIHADQLWMAPYALLARQAAIESGKPPPRLILDQHNAVFQIPQRMAADAHNPLVKALLRREAKLMRQYEVNICRQFAHVVWVTQEDYAAVGQGVALGLANTVIPICIDAESIRPARPMTEEPVVFFLGGMHWPPNADGARWFGREVWPLVKAELPEARWLCVGKKPPAEILDLPGVEAPGYVDDPEPFWRRSRVFIVPLRAGGGMRVKILDAWAHGLPVVSTTIGAEGITYQDGQDICIADGAQAFAGAVVELLRNGAAAPLLAAAGLEKVRSAYDWQAVYPAWQAVYR